MIANQEIVLQTTFSSSNFLLSQIFMVAIVSFFLLVIAVNFIFMFLAIAYEIIFFFKDFKIDNKLYDFILSAIICFSDSKDVVNKYYWSKYFLFLRANKLSLNSFRFHDIVMTVVLISFVIFNIRNLEESKGYIKEVAKDVLVYASYQQNIKECELIDKELLIAFVGTNLVSTYDKKTRTFSYSKCTSNDR